MYFYIDDEIIDTVFEACQTDPASPGLTLKDVQRKECITFADDLVGLGNNDVDELFEVADANGDGIVMRSEVGEVFQSLALQRTNDPYICSRC